MNNFYTIGFAGKTAESFFEVLMEHNIEVLIDIRQHNTSQLSGYSKYPDIKYFLHKICNIDYRSDKYFAPNIELLKKYKTKQLLWLEFKEEFINQQQTIIEQGHYKLYADLSSKKKICFLCSEQSHLYCHRGLVADILKKLYNIDSVHL